MAVAYPAVVGEEDVGAACGIGKVAKHELGVLVHATGCHGDDLDALTGAALDGALQRTDDFALVIWPSCLTCMQVWECLSVVCLHAKM